MGKTRKVKDMKRDRRIRAKNYEHSLKIDTET